MKIGVALGGGGAKGFAHIGILEAIKEEGIQIDIFCGTSIGALIGATYCAGKERKLIKKISDIELFNILSLLSPTVAKDGFFSGKGIIKLISEVIHHRNIEELPKPFAAISVDLIKSEKVVFDSGPLETALRASSSIPLIFNPVKINDQVLVDGALIDPVPVSTAHALGADFVIAIDLFKNKNIHENMHIETGFFKKYMRSVSQNIPALDSFNLKGKAMGMTEISIETLSVIQRELADAHMRTHPPEFLFTPPVKNIGILDFHNGDDEIERCYHWAKKKMPKLIEALSI